MARVGFIGIGTMGLPMARRLLAAGHDVTACDADRARAEALGTAVASTPAEAARDAEVVITSLPSPEAVEEVVLGQRGILAGAPPGSLLLEMSTSPPDARTKARSDARGQARRARRASERGPSRGRGRVADDHGRWPPGCLRAGEAAARRARRPGRPRRRAWRRPGGEALQQPRRRRDDGRARGGLCDRRAGAARPRHAVRAPRLPRPATPGCCTRDSRLPARTTRIPHRVASRRCLPST